MDANILLSEDYSPEEEVVITHRKKSTAGKPSTTYGGTGSNPPIATYRFVEIDERYQTRQSIVQLQDNDHDQSKTETGDVVHHENTNQSGYPPQLVRPKVLPSRRVKEQKIVRSNSSGKESNDVFHLPLDSYSKYLQDIHISTIKYDPAEAPTQHRLESTMSRHDEVNVQLGDLKISERKDENAERKSQQAGSQLLTDATGTQEVRRTSRTDRPAIEQEQNSNCASMTNSLITPASGKRLQTGLKTSEARDPQFRRNSDSEKGLMLNTTQNNPAKEKRSSKDCQSAISKNKYANNESQNKLAGKERKWSSGNRSSQDMRLQNDVTVANSKNKYANNESQNKLAGKERKWSSGNRSSQDMRLQNDVTVANSVGEKENIKSPVNGKKKEKSKTKYQKVPNQTRPKSNTVKNSENETGKRKSVMTVPYPGSRKEKLLELKRHHASQSLFAGHDKINKHVCAIMSWDIDHVSNLSNKTEVEAFIQGLAEIGNVHLQFSVVEIHLNESERAHHSTGEAVIKLDDKHRAKLFKESISKCCETTGFENITIAVQTMLKSHINTIINAHSEAIQTQCQLPMQEHVQKIVILRNEITRLTQQRQNLALDAVDDVMDEISAVEHKIKELEQQNAVFQAFLNDVMSQLSHLKFQTNRFEQRADEIISRYDRELKRFKTALPMYAYRSKIVSLLRDNQVSIIIGETGSGKSTQLAQYIYEDDIQDKAIACTQPRKVAATSLAKRVSEEMNDSLGQNVGYSVGMHQAVSQHTKIKYMTDHSLLKECLKDPTFSSYGCIIVDEAHERSIYTDLLLAMIKKILPRRRDLKVVVTSATINPEVFVKYFGGCPVLRVPGRAYPVEVVYDSDDHVDDYMKSAVAKAFYVHQTQPQGDLLVFLTSPLETERACEQLKEKIKTNDAVILPLHGQLQSSDQNKVFGKLDRGMRKIVFATNCAETSITISGIKYVIDTGFVKERVYDTKRSVNALKIVRITKSSAEQRKGRAGRTQSGVCFRLYTEDTYDTCRHNTTPEIMTMHLGLAFLQLMSLSVTDPLSFDFVESPPREALENALKLLERLGAIEDGKITELGLQLSTLSMEPRLGKFLLEGLGKEIGKEAVIIAAIYSTGVNLFFRGGNDDDKDKSDRLKTLFCKQEGDIFTLLGVFKIWDAVEDANKTRWCNTNSMNAKSARVVRDSVKEITYMLKQELKLPLPRDYADVATVKQIVPKLMLASYSENVAMYLGMPRLGYILPFDEMRNVNIHPSSSLKYLDLTPEWVVFESVLTTSKDYIVSVTSIDKEVITECLEEGILDLDMDAMSENIVRSMGQDVFLGRRVLSTLVGPRFTNMKTIEEKIVNTIGCKTIYIQKENDASVVAYLPPKHHKRAQDILQGEIDKVRKDIKEETLQIDLEEGTGVRVSLQHGCRIEHFLLPNQFVSLWIDAVPSHYTDEDVNKFFATYGEVIKCVKNQRGKTVRWKQRNEWGSVTFNTKDQAEKALASIKALQHVGFKVRPNCNSLGPNVSFTMPFCLKIEWCRRPTKGFAMIKFRNADDYDQCLDNIGGIRLGKNLSKVYPGKHNPLELFAPKLDASITAQEIARCVNRYMNDYVDTDVVSERDIFFPRVNAESFPDEAYQFEGHLEEICTGMNIPKEHFNISVQLIKPKDFTLNAYVRLADPGQINALRIQLKRSVFRGRQPDVELNLKASKTFRQEVYRVVKHDLERAMRELSDDTSDSEEDDDGNEYSQVKFHVEQLRNGMHRLTMTAHDVDTLQTCRQVIGEILEGLEVEQTREFISYLMTQTGKKIIADIEKTFNVYMFVNFRSTSLSVYGPLEAQRRASAMITIHAKEISQLRVADISLRDTPGVIKELFRRFGFTLERLATQVKASRLELVLKRRIIHFQGTETALDALNKQVEALKEGRTNQQDSIELPDCPICFSPVEVDEKHVLEACGHVYCADCVKMVLMNGIKEKKLPIVCAADGCHEGVSIADVRSIIGSTSRDLADLLKAAVENLVVDSRGEYKYCITPNCDAVYKTTTLSSAETVMAALRCYKCDVTICTTCGVDYHTGISCHIYQGRKTDADYDINLYRRRHNVMKCGKCSRLIQKDGGCDHISCPCGAHICAKCHAMFSSDIDTYHHQSLCPGKPRD